MFLFAKVYNGATKWLDNTRERVSVQYEIDPSKKYKGITCFVATKDMGIQIAKKEQKLGIRASSTCTLNFDDMKIPAENIIGGEGQGYKVNFILNVIFELKRIHILQIAIEILNEGVTMLMKCHLRAISYIAL